MQVKITNVRLSYPHLFEKYKSPKYPDSKAKFRASAIMPKDGTEHKKLLEAVEKVAAEKWGAKAKGMLAKIRASSKDYFIKDGDTMPDKPEMVGMVAINTSENVRPLVINNDKTPLVEADGKPYAGCYVNMIIDVYACTTNGDQILAALKGVQFVKDGEAFSSAVPASPDDFDLVEAENNDLF